MFWLQMAAATKLALRLNPVFNCLMLQAANGRYQLDSMSGNFCNCLHCQEQKAKRFNSWYGTPLDNRGREISNKCDDILNTIEEIKKCLK